MVTWLEQIRAAKPTELTAVAEAIRARIIEVVAATGGHLAPSLGVVELSIALHHVFNSPRDGIIWDVGHQAYAHKIITGRDKAFDRLRQLDGISGFPRLSESEHDPFGVGHSSTSISAALGIAEAKRLAGETGLTIAVIGDGSMTGGLAYEGLNNAGHLLNKRLIVVLNDNQMSIDRNVGALARFMNKGLTNPTYNRLRRDFRILLKLLSTKELNLVEISRRAVTVVKDFFLAGSLFEAFGFRYIGPVDGHNIPLLIDTLSNIAKNIEDEEDRARPVLLHVITRKGKGYAPAERDPSKFHGIGPFDPNGASTCAVPASTPQPTYTQAFGEALCELMKLDNRVIAITAAMPTGTGLDAVRERFPGRYYDVGIAELHAVVFAAGMATRGFRPIVAIYSSFLQRAYDAIVHDVCLQRLPVTFAIDRAGIVGEDGATHHGVMDLCYLRHIPNMTVMSPKDADELCCMLWTAVNHDGPMALRYPRGQVPLGTWNHAGVREMEIGISEIVADREDAVCTLFAIGNMVERACEAASLLADEGIPCCVVNARFIKPLDTKLLHAHAHQGRTIVTIEDGVLAGGFGSAVLEACNEPATRRARIVRIGLPDRFIEHGPLAALHERCGLSPAAIAETVRRHVAPRSAAGVVHGLDIIGHVRFAQPLRPPAENVRKHSGDL